MTLLYIFLCLLIAAFTLVYLVIRRWLSHWTDRGVLHDKPVLFFGNMREVGRTQPLRQPFRACYAKYKGQAPFVGFYLFLRPAVVLLDLELVKAVLIKDFSNFADRGSYHNERDDPLSGHLLQLDGPKWRRLRSKLTPTFSSGKMKLMLPSIVEVADKFVDVFGNMLLSEQQRCSNAEFGIEVKELLARFTTDVIGTCAFGIECNSLNDPQTQFRIMGQTALTKRRHKAIVFSLMQAFPNLARMLRMKMVRADVSEFFMRMVHETVEYREREHIKRNDFMNILIELKQTKETEGLTLEQIAAQAFVFFLAGFETSSSTMGFCLYELAMNPQIQERVRDEINTTLERNNGVFTYECMRELKYLQQVIHETLRLYSIASLVGRKTINDYAVPNSKHIIEKGTMVIIPIDAIHHDPDIYPNPEVFDPERFSPVEIEKRSSVSWLAFGEGPRNCIGMRFGEMQSMVGLAMLLKHFRFSPAAKTQIPLKIELGNFLLAADGGIILKVEQI